VASDPCLRPRGHGDVVRYPRGDVVSYPRGDVVSYPRGDAVCVVTDRVASAQVRRISQLPRVDCLHWFQNSVPALRGPGTISDDRITVVIRKSHPFATEFRDDTWMHVTHPGLNLK